VIGYGSQGRAIARNLRDSGYPVLVGLRSRSKSTRLARQDGLSSIVPIGEAAERGNIVVFAFPDHMHGRVYKKSIAPFLKPGVTLWFLHGLSVHFGFVLPPPEADLILIAPHAPGLAVREKFLTDRSISAFSAIHTDHSRTAQATVTAMAAGIGIVESHLVKTSFEAEAIGDLFGEQAVLCGGLAGLIKAGFETLVEAGIKPDHAYLEVAFQLDLIIDLIKRYGIDGMFARISIAAQYGSLHAGPALITADTKKRMRRLLTEIQTGRFPKKLNSLKPADIARLRRSLKTLTDPRLEKAVRKFAAK
jgi:ketol-acid reductoisomerase